MVKCTIQCTEMTAHTITTANLQTLWTEIHNHQHVAVFHSVCNLWRAENECEILSTLQILQTRHKLQQLNFTESQTIYLTKIKVHSYSALK